MAVGIMAAIVPYPTTIMIKNIPSRANAQELLDAIDELGFKGTYDFFYLPDRVPKRGPPVNYGYAFINFKHSQCSADFQEAVATQNVSLRASSKYLTTSLADVQGVEALISCTENSQGKERLVEHPKTGELVSLERLAKLQAFSETVAMQQEVKELRILSDAPAVKPAKQSSKKVAAKEKKQQEEDFGYGHFDLLPPTFDVAMSYDVCDCGSSLGLLDRPMYVNVDSKLYDDLARDCFLMQPQYVLI
eukprot:TRINITY_DN92125_c0_g1_i1.p1 TRINITY_DN92125_c0_g1~~TRINITY_DN92125_c0_g1_i1.p1  ORF type:complete len:277 (+),score=78.37 TRINITY_DN92125_c0_g1_i1:92-832(+)